MLFYMYSQFCERKNICEALLDLEPYLLLKKSSSYTQSKLISSIFNLISHEFRAKGAPLCFRSKIFRQKRSLERQKKYSQQVCLISWTAIINIYYSDLQLRVKIYIYYL